MVAHKCAQVPEVFGEICLASRTVSKCDDIAARSKPHRTARSAPRSSMPTTCRPTRRPDRAIQARPGHQRRPALPGPAIMDACLETGVDYLDTANYEPPDEASSDYKWQWAYHERFREAGIMALLGCGFDPGVTNVFCAYALKAPLRRDPRRSTSSTATPATTASPSPPTSTRRSTSARSPPRAATGRTATGSRPTRCPSSAAFDFPEGIGPQGSLPDVPRGTGIAGQAHPGLQADPVLDDLLARTTSTHLRGAARTSA